MYSKFRRFIHYVQNIPLNLNKVRERSYGHILSAILQVRTSECLDRRSCDRGTEGRRYSLTPPACVAQNGKLLFIYYRNISVSRDSTSGLPAAQPEIAILDLFGYSQYYLIA